MVNSMRMAKEPQTPSAWAIAVGPSILTIRDFGTAILLFMVLGWHWLLLPGLVMEAIPGLGILLLWLMVVGAIAVLGTARPKLK
jgi:hypothetical protein